MQEDLEAVQQLEQTLIINHGVTVIPSLKDASKRLANLVHGTKETESIVKAVFILVGVSDFYFVVSIKTQVYLFIWV